MLASSSLAVCLLLQHLHREAIGARRIAALIQRSEGGDPSMPVSQEVVLFGALESEEVAPPVFLQTA